MGAIRPAINAARPRCLTVRLNRRMFNCLRQVLALFMLLCLSWSARTAAATDQVVNDCSNDTELRSDLFSIQNGGGGTLTFACGTASITLTGGTLPNIDAATVVDGGGLITLSGGNAYRIFTTGSGGSLTLKDITLTLGSAPGTGSAGDGGCIWNYGTLTLDNATLHHCYANQDGGAIFNHGNGSVGVVNSILRDNTASRDCGAICYGSLIFVQGSSILSNTAQTRNVGGIGSVSTVVVNTSTIDTNWAAGNGGGVFSNGYSSLFNVTLSYNHANACGGGLFVGAGTTAIYASVIHSNTAGADPCAGTGFLAGGGGIAVWGALNISDSTLEENATAAAGGGLYVENSGTASLTRTALVGNRADADGGGSSISASAITLTNTTFNGNFASGYGGALDLVNFSGAATARLTNVTMVANHTAGLGAGGIRYFGTLSLNNTLLSDNRNANCAGSGTFSASFSLSSDNTCAFGGGRDNVNAMLSPFGYYGGSNWTFLPMPGSPAVDGGTLAGCPLTDQRGYSRPVGLSCDIGAVERRPGDPAAFLSLPIIRR